ncbi:MAG: YkgJ family cysteine cluster protein [Phycisphaerae bacterium]
MSLLAPNPPWYAAGLAFECLQCGRCCAGPEEGYVWVSDAEITAIAAFLRITPEELRRTYLRRVSGRYTILEQKHSRDCMFLQPSQDGRSARRCAIYMVRPAQCRTWPFWRHNLTDPAAWSRAAARCPGINRGRLFAIDEIHARQEKTSE